ncbi:MAG: class I SAM-dependent methyltransferase [Actinomycetota bacterium]|nr:class I SAM-dependent methyltransferase [Actinomycetota bacterium]MEC8119308.1 class I SAM-dependent methyltransferase [Actinomycetota bacterium]
MDSDQVKVAEAVKGFLPKNEAAALYDAAIAVEVDGPLLEVGSYCGKSSVYLGYAAQSIGRVLYALDHHRGSEENQAGWEHHDSELIDKQKGVMDTLPYFRDAIFAAGLEHVVIALVGHSGVIARNWTTPLSFLFIDGGHGEEPAKADFNGWVPKVKEGGILAIHDVFPNPKDGGRPPYEQIYLPAIESGNWNEVHVEGSLRILKRV